jgi:hypothetical protein
MHSIAAHAGLAMEDMYGSDEFRGALVSGAHDIRESPGKATYPGR